jgi:tetratricopeptide (TPR) repeat protein
VTQRIKSSAIALALLGLVLAYATAATRFYLAQRAASTNTIEGLETARRLVPWNAEYSFVLARSHTLASLDFARGISEYQRALALNPYSSRGWLDLAAAYQMAGDNQNQIRAMEKAVQVDPMTPSVAWEVASFYILQGSVQQAIPHYRTVLSSEGPPTRAVLDILWPETQHDAKVILEKALPPVTDVHAEFLRFAAQEKDVIAAKAIWARLITLRPPVKTADALPYIQLLLDSGDPDGAVKAAQELAALRPEMKEYLPTSDNLIVNGDFENPVLGGGLEWTFAKQVNTDLNTDSLEFHSGNHSLSATIEAIQIPTLGISQRVPVQGGGQYSFSVFVKASELNTAYGPRISIADAYTGERFFLSDDQRGTSGWKQIETVLNVPASTKALRVEVIREPWNGLIKGKFYIDDFVLRRDR